MGFWSMIRPQAAINLVLNPTLETATTGYTASGAGASVARSAAYQKWGLYSLAVTPGAGVNNGVYYGTVSLTTATAYVASVYIKGATGISYNIWFADTSANIKGTAKATTATGGWQRVEVTWTCDSSTTYRIYITKNNSADTGVFYIDGLQVEAETVATTYIDGDQKGCYWNGVPGEATSTRDAQSRAGGEIVDLTSLGVYVREFAGLGMPNAKHYTQDLSLQPGAAFFGRKILPRGFELGLDLDGTSWGNMHKVRRDFIDLIKPDLVRDDQEILLRYSGGNSSALPLEIACVYDTGLGFANPRGFTEEAKLRLLAYDPFFYQEGEQATSLSTSQDLTVQSIILKNAGVWSALGGGANALVYCQAFDYNRGILYVGGNFTSIGGTSANRIAKYNIGAGTWAALDTGCDAYVRSIALDAAGNVYATGAFDSAGGVANTVGIAMWNGTAWSALGTGMGSASNVGLCLVIDQSGYLYCGGVFAKINSVTCNGVGKWDGSAWSALGTATGGGTSAVKALAVGVDGKLYAGGDFTSMDGDSDISFMAEWGGTAWAPITGGNPDDDVQALAVAMNGDIYAGGEFHNVGSLAAAHIAKWNRQSWSTLSTGVNDIVYSLWHDGLQLFLSGQFTTAGGIAITDRMATWNGTVFGNLDVNLPGSPPIVYSILNYPAEGELGNPPIMRAWYPPGLMVIGGEYGSGTAVVSYSQVVTIASTDSTRTVHPVIYLQRVGGTTARLEWIKNESTGKTLRFNYAMQSGESLTIDCRPFKQKMESSHYGDVWRAMQRGSDFAEFGLLPGANRLSIKLSVTGAPTITMYLKWRNSYWSFDGAAS